VTDVSTGDRVFVHVEKPGTVMGVYTCCGEERVSVELDGDSHPTRFAARYVTVVPCPGGYRYFSNSPQWVYRVPADATPDTVAECRSDPTAPWLLSIGETLSSLQQRVRDYGWKESVSA
jgi:hypothetical protein